MAWHDSYQWTDQPRLRRHAARLAALVLHVQRSAAFLSSRCGSEVFGGPCLHSATVRDSDIPSLFASALDISFRQRRSPPSVSDIAAHLSILETAWLQHFMKHLFQLRLLRRPEPQLSPSISTTIFDYTAPARRHPERDKASRTSLHLKQRSVAL